MRFLTLALSVVVMLALAVPPAAAGVVFTLDPFDGALVGAPGQVLGWGLTIQNDDSGWLVITSAAYDQSQAIGDFSDFVTPQFLTYAVAPNGVWSETFDAATQMGLGSYVIGDFASPGDMAIGTLVLLYDVHSLDPNAGGDGTDTVYGYQVQLPGPEAGTDGIATVTYTPGTNTPEPAVIGTTLIGLAVVLGKCARRRR